jgi:hypothetical protein
VVTRAGINLKPTPEADGLAAVDRRLPCPFCGSHCVSFIKAADVGRHFCEDCGAQGPTAVMRDTPKDSHWLRASRALWNTRISDIQNREGG